MPGKWYAQNGKIHVINSDGTEEILDTDWEDVRRRLEEEKRLAKQQSLQAIQHNQAEKREQVSKKRGGRGC